MDRAYRYTQRRLQLEEEAMPHGNDIYTRLLFAAIMELTIPFFNSNIIVDDAFDC